MTRITLYTLAAEYRQLAARLADIQEDEQAIFDTLEGERWPLEQKAQAIVHIIDDLTKLAEASREAKQRLAALIDARKRRAERLKDYLQLCMETAGVTQIDCPEFSLAIHRKAAAVEIYDERLLPDDYWRLPEPKPEPDKKKIGEALKSGMDVPGAKFGPTTRLSIK